MANQYANLTPKQLIEQYQLVLRYGTPVNFIDSIYYNFA